MLALIVLLSYFFYTKYKFLLDYIDSRIDLKLEKFNTKYNLENLNEINKIKEQDYINDLKNNIINDNTENFFSKINDLSDVEEESIIDDGSEYDNVSIKEEDIEQSEEIIEEPTQEQIQEPTEEPTEDKIKQIELENFDFSNDIPNLESLEDNVDNYIQSILNNDEQEELVLDENSIEKKN